MAPFLMYYIDLVGQNILNYCKINLCLNLKKCISSNFLTFKRYFLAFRLVVNVFFFYIYQTFLLR